jgi:hypothetical protein
MFMSAHKSFLLFSFQDSSHTVYLDSHINLSQHRSTT